MVVSSAQRSQPATEAGEGRAPQAVSKPETERISGVIRCLASRRSCNLGHSGKPILRALQIAQAFETASPARPQTRRSASLPSGYLKDITASYLAKPARSTPFRKFGDVFDGRGGSSSRSTADAQKRLPPVRVP